MIEVRSENAYMRVSPIVSAALVLCMSGSAFAQEYVEFKSQQDRFTVVFPAQPKVTETTFRSQFDSMLPARIYSADANGGNHRNRP